MRLRALLCAALFAALTAIGGFLKIPLPLGLMSCTLQFFFTALSGLLLGPRYGALSQGIYVLLGLAGAPVFMLGGGLSYLLQPSFGFLLGLIPGAYLTGLLGARAKRPAALLAAILAGFAAIYAVGLPYLWAVQVLYLGNSLTAGQLFRAGCAVYLPGDLLKAAAAAALCPQLRKRLPRRFYPV